MDSAVQLRITRVIAQRSRWVIGIVLGRNERDPKGVDLFILALQRKTEGRLAFLGGGTPPSHQTYYDQSKRGVRVPNYAFHRTN